MGEAGAFSSTTVPHHVEGASHVSSSASASAHEVDLGFVEALGDNNGVLGTISRTAEYCTNSSFMS